MGKLKNEKTLSFQKLVDDWNENYSKYSEDDILSTLKERVTTFEAKYRMPTSEFVERYDRGEFETDDTHPGHDLFVWRSSYRKYWELSAKLKKSQK